MVNNFSRPKRRSSFKLASSFISHVGTLANRKCLATSTIILAGSIELDRTLQSIGYDRSSYSSNESSSFQFFSSGSEFDTPVLV